MCVSRLCKSFFTARVSPGFLLNFISFPVIKGFTCAAAVTIGFGQVKVSARRSRAVTLYYQFLYSLARDTTED